MLVLLVTVEPKGQLAFQLVSVAAYILTVTAVIAFTNAFIKA